MSKIEWTDKTWNPVTGCNKVSQGCKNCYAEVMHRRLMVLKPSKYTKPFLHGAEEHYDELDRPKRWRKPCRVFVNSMSDLFHPDVSFEFITDVFHTMQKTPQHTYQILTKRPERMLEFMTEYVPNPYGSPYDPLPNVWLGVSCEDQAAADERIPLLLQVPATVRFLSCEPLLGPIDIGYFKGPILEHKIESLRIGHGPTPGIHWVIAGGESGHGARPMSSDWVLSLRDQCIFAGVPFFFKQWGEWGEIKVPAETNRRIARLDNGYLRIYTRNGKAATGRSVNGKYWNQFPS